MKPENPPTTYFIYRGRVIALLVFLIIIGIIIAYNAVHTFSDNPLLSPKPSLISPQKIVTPLISPTISASPSATP